MSIYFKNREDVYKYIRRKARMAIKRVRKRARERKRVRERRE